MLASIETFFIFLLIAGGSALFNWLKKRGEKSEDWSESEMPPPTRRTPTSTPPLAPPVSRPAKTTNWEEELRRMLEGAVPTTQNPAPPPLVIQERKPPPVVRQPSPFPQERPTMTLPKSFEQKFYKAHCNYCDEHIEFPSSAMEEVISCPHCYRPTVLRPFENTRVETLAHQTELSSFASVTKKYDAAANLSERVAAHMHGVGHQAVGMTSIESTKKLWPEVAETKALFKNAKTVRQAMIASLILCPPKALEN
ncbi:MAG: hypothetical protein ABIR24_09675 [Verrucomicrobiota bacterium]